MGDARFFSEAADEFAALGRKVTIFLRRSDISLTLAKRLRTMDAKDARATCEELVQERRNTLLRTAGTCLASLSDMG
jgi:hypothetical protein